MKFLVFQFKQTHLSLFLNVSGRPKMQKKSRISEILEDFLAINYAQLGKTRTIA